MHTARRATTRPSPPAAARITRAREANAGNIAPLGPYRFLVPPIVLRRTGQSKWCRAVGAAARPGLQDGRYSQIGDQRRPGDCAMLDLVLRSTRVVTPSGE